MAKKPKKTTDVPNNRGFQIIKVAILAEEPLGWGSGKHYFPVILDGYTWNIGDKSFKFSTEYIFDKDILHGRLNVSNYDVLLVPGGGVGDGEAIVKGFNVSRKVRRWKKHICNFIKNGGGYLGICGGTALITGLSTGPGKTPVSFLEKQYNKSGFGISCVTSYYKHLAFPLFYLFQRRYPEKIGATGYVFSFNPGETVDGTRIHAGGVPVDFQLFKDNPIFSDFKDKTIRIRWWGGPALEVPEKPDREVKILARYPKQDFSINESTKIFAWRYTGSIYGLIKSFFKSLKMVKNENSGLKNILMYTYYLAGNWEPSDRFIELDFSNKSCMTAEIYPNENKGRILLCAAHPEYMIWWGGHIEEVNASGFNNLANGLHQWKNIKSLSKNIEDELTYTWWIVRRITAWVAKVPDNYLPPITKGKIAEKANKIIKENILWDGTLIDQMKNI